MASAFIKKLNGKNVIEIDGKLFNGAAATVCNNRNGNIMVDENYYRNLYNSGIKLFFVMCDLDFSGKNGYENFCNEIKVIIKAAPDCYLIPRIALHPSAEWVEKHPNAVVKYSDGISRPAVIRQESGSIKCKDGYALYSKEWKHDAGQALLDFIKRINKENFADKIVGYFLGAGSCSEWHSIAELPVGIDEPYYDLNDDFISEFQSYLDDKYGFNAKKADLPNNELKYFVYGLDESVALKAGVPSSFLKTLPQLPSNGTTIGTFLDINKHQNVVDFFIAQGVATANSLVYFANIIKDVYPNKLVGAFFGYTNGVHLSMNLAGLSVVLNSGVVDFCAAPGCYENRGLGGNEPVRTIRDTYNIHNMVFFAEDDTRTHLEPFEARSSYGIYTKEDSVDVIKRNFAKNFCGGNYSWWYDQQLGGGRFNSETIFNIFNAQSKICEDAGVKRFEKQNEIALIYDIESCVSCSNYTSHYARVPLKNYSLGKIGAGYDEYLVEDLGNSEMPNYKLYIFSTAYNLDNKKRELISKKLQKNHATALWLYGAGFMNPDKENKVDVKYMTELTGFEVEIQENVVYDGKFRVQGMHGITKELKVRYDYGGIDEQMFSNQAKQQYVWLPYLSPRFVVKDDNAITLGVFNEEQDVAFAFKKYNGFKSIYCGVKYLQYDVIASIAKYAGCHIYSNDGDVMYFSSNYIAIHASSSGTKKIKFLNNVSPYEVYEKKFYGKSVKSIKFKMIRGQTKMFQIR